MDSDKTSLEIAKQMFKQGYHIKALKRTQGLSSVQGMVDQLEGEILEDLGMKSRNSDLKVTFLLGSVACFSRVVDYIPVFTVSAKLLLDLAEQCGSFTFYEEALRNAKIALEFIASPELVEDRESMEEIMVTAKSKMANPETIYRNLGFCLQKNWGTENNDRLKTYWLGLKVDSRRDFMKVRVDELKTYVEAKTGELGVVVLDNVLKFVKRKQRWTAWVCRNCSKRFITPEECQNHIGDEHVPKSEPQHIPQRIDQVWAHKVRAGGWEPLDLLAAVQMIQDQFADVKGFVYQDDGWCKDWRLAQDIERSTLLKQVRSLLLSFIQQKVFSDSMRQKAMDFVAKQLEKLQVSKQTLVDCGLLLTPQSICLLEAPELCQILEFLRQIKYEMDDGADLVCRAVTSFWQNTRVKEKIDFDSDFSFLLLDKRLLIGDVEQYDDEGRIVLRDPTRHYRNVHSRSDALVSWITDHYTEDDDGFEFPKPIHTHHFDVWLAVLRTLELTSRTLGNLCAKRLELLEYDTALTEARELIEKETSTPNEEKTFASRLCRICSDSSNLFLWSMRGVIKGEMCMTLDLPYLVDCRRIISEMGNEVKKTRVLNSIRSLESTVKDKVVLLDSKILVFENSRIQYLNSLTKLAFFDYRSYIDLPLKRFLLNALKRGLNENAR